MERVWNGHGADSEIGNVSAIYLLFPTIFHKYLNPIFAVYSYENFSLHLSFQDATRNNTIRKKLTTLKTDE